MLGKHIIMSFKDQSNICFWKKADTELHHINLLHIIPATYREFHFPEITAYNNLVYIFSSRYISTYR